MAQPGQPVPTVTELLLRRERDHSVGLLFEEEQWTWAEHVQECADRAALLNSLRRPGPFHIGVLLDNVPEFSFLLGGAALSGAVLVGLNTTRRGHALARDVRLAECQVIITDSRYVELLDELNLGAAAGRVLNIDTAAWHMSLFAHKHRRLDPVAATANDLLMLIFTSGTGGDPKAVRCTHEKISGPGCLLAERFSISPHDTVYVSMPMFHSNAIMAGWAVALASGAAMAMRRRFSASNFLDDVRKFGVTYANYVGKPLSHILATEPKPDDANNSLRLMFGNEANQQHVDRFAERFGCVVVDAYGSTEGGIVLPRPDGMPVGSIGQLAGGVDILDTETGKPCPPAQFDGNGRIVNAEEAVGELVNTTGPGSFAGYYGDPSADQQRIREGMFWSGDLAYRDEDGFAFFYGRSDEWLRVDGENLGTAPIERILLRHPDVVDAAVYAVSDPSVGDQVMAALVMVRDCAFDADDFADFLSVQGDLGPKQVPRFIRVAKRLPRTPTHKVLKRSLRSQGWRCSDPVWWRASKEIRYQPLTSDVTPIQLDGDTRHVRG